MRNILLGTPPDQITEAEKLRRLQNIADRWLALHQQKCNTVEEIIDKQKGIIALHEEEQELDRRYPDVP